MRQKAKALPMAAARPCACRPRFVRHQGSFHRPQSAHRRRDSVPQACELDRGVRRARPCRRARGFSRRPRPEPAPGAGDAMIYLLDTNTVSDIVKGQSRHARRKLERVSVDHDARSRRYRGGDRLGLARGKLLAERRLPLSCSSQRLTSCLGLRRGAGLCEGSRHAGTNWQAAATWTFDCRPGCRRGSGAGDERPHFASVLEAYRGEADAQLGRRCGSETLTGYRQSVSAAKRLNGRGGALKDAHLRATCSVLPAECAPAEEPKVPAQPVHARIKNRTPGTLPDAAAPACAIAWPGRPWHKKRSAGPALRSCGPSRPVGLAQLTGKSPWARVPPPALSARAYNFGVRFLILAWTGWAGTFWLFGGSTFSR